MGGRRPLSFLVDGAPLPSDRIRREVRANVQVGDMP